MKIEKQEKRKLNKKRLLQAGAKKVWTYSCGKKRYRYVFAIWGIE